MPSLSLVLLRLEFIIGLIESACTSLLLPNPDPLLCKIFGSFSDIDVRIESIICEEGLKMFAEEGIGVGKEDSGTSTFNKSYDKLKANQDKAQTRQLLDLAWWKVHGRINQ